MQRSPKLRLAAYLRVSSASQLDGYGLDVQHEAVHRWAEANGHEVVVEYRDEGVPGTTAVRPGLSAALADLDVQGVVVARIDRLARTLTLQEAILAMMWRADLTVIAVDMGEVQQDDPDDPMRTAMRQMAGVFAELDRAMVVKRLRDGRRKKKAQPTDNHAEGRYPYGASPSGPVPDEVHVIEHVACLRSADATWQQVAADLNERGPRWAPRTAGRWTPANARKVFAVGSSRA